MPTLKEKIVSPFSQITPRKVDWLWPRCMAGGTLVLLDGDPDGGKSLVTLDLAARLSSGRPWPDGEPVPGPAGVVLLGSEDSPDETVLPRLQAAGADLARVHRFHVRAPDGGERLPVFPDDCDLLYDVVRESAARLVVVDTFLDFLAPGLSSLNSASVRLALVPLARLAAQTGAAILLVRHLTKKALPDRRALCRGAGAMALVGAARSAFLVASPPGDPGLHLLACTKNNLAPHPPTLSYRIATDPAGLPLLDWQGPVSETADDLFRSAAPAAREHGHRDEAVAFLEDLLRHGPASHATVMRMGRAVGLSDRTIERAKAQLGVLSTQKREDDTSVWYWSLPPDLDSDRIMKDLFGFVPGKDPRPGSVARETPAADHAGAEA